MKRFQDTDLGKYITAIAHTVHPVRAIFEICGTILFAIPFLAAFAMTRSAPIYLYLLYPLLFLINDEIDVVGVPLLYAYVFAVWAGLIALMAWVIERREA